jgi:isopenicillin-N N-acyltransferase-like protein
VWLATGIDELTMHKYATLTLRGDHYTMGRQHGHQVKGLRPLLAQAIEARFAQIEGDGPDGRFETLLQGTRELLQDVDPPLLAMIQGQAKTLEFEFDTLLRYNLVTYLRDDLLTRQPPAGSVGDRPEQEGCTTWAATGSAAAGGQPILVKNRDNRLEHLPLQVVIHAAPESGYRYVCSNSAGRPGVSCAGINQAGLAVADTHVCSTDLGPGLPDYALMMHLLEDHDSVSSAVDYLRSVPRLGRNSLILADAQGYLAVFEIGHRSYGLFEAHDGALVNTNHFVSPELRDCYVDVHPPSKRGNSFRRYRKVTRELNAAWGQIDVAFAQRLMAAHDGPRASICRHPMVGSDAATLSTSIFLPAHRTMLFCHGPPCQGQYDEFVL